MRFSASLVPLQWKKRAFRPYDESGDAVGKSARCPAEGVGIPNLFGFCLPDKIKHKRHANWWQLDNRRSP